MCGSSPENSRTPGCGAGASSINPRSMSSGTRRSISLAPRNRSTSGNACSSSARWRSTMHPTATTACARPSSLSRPACTIASMDSFLAASMNPQVLTRMTSASSTTSVGSAPRSASSARYRSESTVFLSQPRVTTETFIALEPKTCSGAPGLAIISELELDTEVFASQERHCALQVVLRGRRDSDLVSLYRRLDFLELRVLDGRRDFLGRVAVQRGLELDLAADGVVAGRRDLADVEVLDRYVPLDQPRLDDVEQRLHLEIAVGREIQDRLRAPELDRGLGALEVVSLRNFFLCLIDGVVDLLEVHSRRDVE